MENNNGKVILISPGRYLATIDTQDPEEFAPGELRTLLDCESIEVVNLPNFPLDDVFMIVDECGKLKPHSLNPIATVLYAPGQDYIAGDALLVKRIWRGRELDLAPFTAHQAEVLMGFISMYLGTHLAQEINTSAKSAEGGQNG